MCGKWHMGDDDVAQAGFTYWATVPGGGGTYRSPTFVHNGSPEKVDKFKTDAVADFAIDFLNRQTGEHPFYLLVPFYAPHTPYDYQPDEYQRPYLDSEFQCFPNVPQSPWQNENLKGMHGKRQAKLAYSALITGVDTNVGRILKRLEELKLRDNTLVIFTADQGWNAGHHGVWGKGNGTQPFNMYEESLRVPLIWNHPGRIIPGQTLAPLVSSYDFFPTILDHLGIHAPLDRLRVGQSYAGFLRGQRPSWRSRLYFEYAYVRAIRTKNLKYIERADGWPSEMYDLESDPGETKNIINDPAYQSQTGAFHRELSGYFERLGAPPIQKWRDTTSQTLPKDDFTRKPEGDRWEEK
jgi:choline-sulfatase